MFENAPTLIFGGCRSGLHDDRCGGVRVGQPDGRGLWPTALLPGHCAHLPQAGPACRQERCQPNDNNFDMIQEKNNVVQLLKKNHKNSDKISYYEYHTILFTRTNLYKFRLGKVFRCLPGLSYPVWAWQGLSRMTIRKNFNKTIVWILFEFKYFDFATTTLGLESASSRLKRIWATLRWTTPWWRWLACHRSK